MAWSGVDGNWKKLPVTLVNVASILTVPEVLRAEEASTIPASETGNSPAAVHQKDIPRDIDIAPVTTEGLGKDLAVIQNDELRIDRNVAAISYPALNARRDLAVGQSHY